jgi:hypothetical protein
MSWDGSARRRRGRSEEKEDSGGQGGEQEEYGFLLVMASELNLPSIRLLHATYIFRDEGGKILGQKG